MPSHILYSTSGGISRSLCLLYQVANGDVHKVSALGAAMCITTALDLAKQCHGVLNSSRIYLLRWV